MACPVASPASTTTRLSFRPLLLRRREPLPGRQLPLDEDLAVLDCFGSRHAGC